MERGTGRTPLDDQSDRRFTFDSNLWFDDAFKTLPDDQGKEVFQFRCPLENFAAEVLGCGQGLLAEHTSEGYLDVWGYEFPEEEFGKLEWLISKRKGSAQQGAEAKG